jgi:FixJ family two-component response regulator
MTYLRADSPVDQGRPSRPSPGPGVDGPIVFVVDDEEPVRRALDRLLRSVRLDVQTFRSAEEFLGYPIPNRLSCVIVDLRLPGPSGLDLQDTLVRGGRELPMIFISGYADVTSSVRAMKAGAVDFLLKPFSDEVLLDIIEQALRRDRMARRARADRDEVTQRFDTLTPRERQVMDRVLQGRLNKQIAGDLGITEKTVKFHRGRLMRKTQAGTVAGLVQLAAKLAIRPPAT